MSDQPAIDYDRMMRANLALFGERDPGRRIIAIREVYAVDGVLHEPDATAKGHVAICDAVTALLASLPLDFIFLAVRPGTGHNGVGLLNWRAGPPGAPAAVTGTDVAHFEGGRIRSLHVFLDPTST